MSPRFKRLLLQSIQVVTMALARVVVGGEYSHTCPPLGAVHLGGEAGRKADALFAQRVFGEEAKGVVYEEAVNAFRTHYDDTRPDMKEPWGLWQGEYWGKTMLSSALVSEYAGDSAHCNWLKERALAFVAEFQQPDGYLGTYKDRYFVGGPRLNNPQAKGWGHEIFCWNLWGRKYTMWALLELARVTESKELLMAADRMMTQEIDQLEEKNVRIENTGFFVGMPSMSVLKPLLVLYRATGRERYREFARDIVRAWDREGNPKPNLIANAYGPKPVHDWYPEALWWAKAYEMMSCMEGLIDWAVHEDDRRTLDAVKRLVAKLEFAEGNAVGSVGFFDHFINGAAFVNACTEPCDVIHWIRVNRDLFLATDDPHYLESVEKAYLNAFLSGVHRDGRWGAHAVRSHGSRHRVALRKMGMTHHHCCVDNMPRTFMDMAQTVVTRRRDGVLSVNLYSDADVRIGDDTVRISGGYPISDDVKVVVTSKHGCRMRFRVPASYDAVAVDGCAVQGPWFVTDMPAGTRAVTLHFTRTPRICPTSTVRVTDPELVGFERDMFEKVDENAEMKGFSRTNHGVCVMYGPILLAKGLYAGTDKSAIFKDVLAPDGRAGLRIAPCPRIKTEGAWILTFSGNGAESSVKVGDFASIADVDDPKNSFSIWF